MLMVGNERIHMPSLHGAAGWLNSDPLRTEQLRGSVTVVNFWTLTCINWLRTEAYVRAWSKAYRDNGLVVIGVHTPEFSFEHRADLVSRATKDRDIDYPVALDNDYAIWSAFDNHYWPALYFIDKDGIIRDDHFGEGRYAESERVIQQLLGIDREPLVVEPAGVEAEADWQHLRTPETYLGYQRGERFASQPNEDGDYQFPAYLDFNHWALAGNWTIGAERVSLNQSGGSIAFRFQARDAHVVLSSRDSVPVPFHVLLDGEAPGPSHGIDIDEAGAGTFTHGRLYQLIRQQGEIAERTLEITFAAPGVDAYVFTFG